MKRLASSLPPLYICDLDGTLCNVDHRRHFVDGDKQDFEAFNHACVDDTPNHAVVKTLAMLKSCGAEIWLWSGRDDYVLHATLLWLQRYEIGYDDLQMRRAGDSTPDDELKESWLHAMQPYDRRRLVAVFDDRDSVVAQWRRNHVVCFQVAPGDF